MKRKIERYRAMGSLLLHITPPSTLPLRHIRARVSCCSSGNLVFICLWKLNEIEDIIEMVRLFDGFKSRQCLSLSLCVYCRTVFCKKMQ